MEKVVVERIVERAADTPEQKDWAPLMADFDRRMERLEKKQ